MFINKAPVSSKESLSQDHVQKALLLEAVSTNHRVNVVNSDGLSGAGVDDGFGWLRAVF